MAWTIEFDERAEKDLSRPDKPVQRMMIWSCLRERIAPLDNPTVFGKELQHEYAGIWRHRVGDYCTLCRVETDAVIVLVIAVGHRKNIYDRPMREQTPRLLN